MVGRVRFERPRHVRQCSHHLLARDRECDDDRQRRHERYDYGRFRDFYPFFQR